MIDFWKFNENGRDRLKRSNSGQVLGHQEALFYHKKIWFVKLIFLFFDASYYL